VHIDLTGRVVIVTGAGKGIGRSIALTFADEGARVVAIDREEEDLVETTDRINRAGGTVRGYALDVCDGRAVTGMIERTVTEFKRVDVLVNNAGVSANGPIDGLPTDIWQQNLDVNLTAVVRLCQAVIPIMKRQRGGRILNAASYAALTPIAGGVWQDPVK
jgi:3-oxoacyl-[acyl-carrier protein] reductase